MTVAYHRDNKMPDSKDLDPVTGCCWWFNRMNYAWELGDSSWRETFEWWIPYGDIADPYS